MLAIGDIVVQRGGRQAGRVGVIVRPPMRNGYLVARDASGREFWCQRGNVRTVLDMLRAATIALNYSARGTTLQFYASMNEWTRLAQLCHGLGLSRDAARIVDLCNQQGR